MFRRRPQSYQPQSQSSSSSSLASSSQSSSPSKSKGISSAKVNVASGAGVGGAGGSSGKSSPTKLSSSPTKNSPLSSIAPPAKPAVQQQTHSHSYSYSGSYTSPSSGNVPSAAAYPKAQTQTQQKASTAPGYGGNHLRQQQISGTGQYPSPSSHQTPPYVPSHSYYHYPNQAMVNTQQHHMQSSYPPALSMYSQQQQQPYPTHSYSQSHPQSHRSYTLPPNQANNQQYPYVSQSSQQNHPLSLRPRSVSPAPGAQSRQSSEYQQQHGYSNQSYPDSNSQPYPAGQGRGQQPQLYSQPISQSQSQAQYPYPTQQTHSSYHASTPQLSRPTRTQTLPNFGDHPAPSSSFSTPPNNAGYTSGFGNSSLGSYPPKQDQNQNSQSQRQPQSRPVQGLFGPPTPLPQASQPQAQGDQTHAPSQSRIQEPYSRVQEQIRKFQMQGQQVNHHAHSQSQPHLPSQYPAQVTIQAQQYDHRGPSPQPGQYPPQLQQPYQHQTSLPQRNPSPHPHQRGPSPQPPYQRDPSSQPLHEMQTHHAPHRSLTTIHPHAHTHSHAPQRHQSEGFRLNPNLEFSRSAAPQQGQEFMQQQQQQQQHGAYSQPQHQPGQGQPSYLPSQQNLHLHQPQPAMPPQPLPSLTPSPAPHAEGGSNAAYGYHGQPSAPQQSQSQMQGHGFRAVSPVPQSSVQGQGQGGGFRAVSPLPSPSSSGPPVAQGHGFRAVSPSPALLAGQHQHGQPGSYHGSPSHSHSPSPSSSPGPPHPAPGYGYGPSSSRSPSPMHPAMRPPSRGLDGPRYGSHPGSVPIPNSGLGISQPPHPGTAPTPGIPQQQFHPPFPAREYPPFGRTPLPDQVSQGVRPQQNDPNVPPSSFSSLYNQHTGSVNSNVNSAGSSAPGLLNPYERSPQSQSPVSPVQSQARLSPRPNSNESPTSSGSPGKRPLPTPPGGGEGSVVRRVPIPTRSQTLPASASLHDPIPSTNANANHASGVFPTRQEIRDVDVSNTHVDTNADNMTMAQQRSASPSSPTQVPSNSEHASTQPVSPSRSSPTLPSTSTVAPKVDETVRLIKEGGPFKLPPRRGTIALGGLGALIGKFEGAGSGSELGPFSKDEGGNSVRFSIPSTTMPAVSSPTLASNVSPLTGASSISATRSVEGTEDSINPNAKINVDMNPPSNSPKSMTSPSVQSPLIIETRAQSPSHTDTSPSQQHPSDPILPHISTFGAPPSPPPSPHPNHVRSGPSSGTAGWRKSVSVSNQGATVEKKEMAEKEKEKEKGKILDDEHVLNVIGAAVDAAIGVAGAVEAASPSSRSPSIAAESISLSSPPTEPASISPGMKPGSIVNSPSFSPSVKAVSPTLAAVPSSTNSGSISPMTLKEHLPSARTFDPNGKDTDAVSTPTLPSHSPSIPLISIPPQQPVISNYVQIQDAPESVQMPVQSQSQTQPSFRAGSPAKSSTQSRPQPQPPQSPVPAQMPARSQSPTKSAPSMTSNAITRPFVPSSQDSRSPMSNSGQSMTLRLATMSISGNEKQQQQQPQSQFLPNQYATTRNSNAIMNEFGAMRTPYQVQMAKHGHGHVHGRIGSLEDSPPISKIRGAVGDTGSKARVNVGGTPPASAGALRGRGQGSPTGYTGVTAAQLASPGFRPVQNANANAGPPVPVINLPEDDEDDDDDDDDEEEEDEDDEDDDEDEYAGVPSITVSHAPSITVSTAPSITYTSAPTISVTSSEDASSFPAIVVKGVEDTPSVKVEGVPSIIMDDLAGNFDSASQQQRQVVSQPRRQARGFRALGVKGGLKCYGCGKSIVGRIVSAMGGRWHPECFRCCVCGEHLEHISSYEHEGQAYCHLDYHEKFAPQCYHCRTPIIDEQFITLDDPALGKRTYHELHFFCAECGDPFIPPSRKNKGADDSIHPSEIDVGFTVYQGHPYCEACHVRLRYPKCRKCKKSVRDGQGVEALGGIWCIECFVCVGCLRPFENHSFFQRGNKPFCESCFSLILKNEL